MKKHLALMCLVFAFGCDTELTVADGISLSCEDDSDCIDDFECLTSINRCVRQGGSADVPTLDAASLVVAPSVVSRGGTVTVSFSVSTALARAPDLAFIDSVGGVFPLQLVTQDAGAYSYTYNVGDLEREGSAGLRIELLSSANVPASTEQPRAIEYDFTPPQLVDDTNRMEIIPPAGTLRDDVSHATVGGRVDAFFAMNEPLRSEITVATNDEPPLEFTCDSPLGTFYGCELDLSEAIRDGTRNVTAAVTDIAGNPALVAIGAFQFDATPMPAPDLSTRGQITYVRVPHGSSDRPVPYNELEVRNGVVVEGAEIVVWDRRDIENAVELGRGPVGPGNAVAPIAINGISRPEVFVSVLDEAGNVSDDDEAEPGFQGTKVRDVRWIATLNGKVALDSLSNPHELEERGWFGDSLQQRDGRELSDGGNLSEDDGRLVRTRGAGRWELIQQLSRPFRDTSTSTVYDSWRGATLALSQGSSLSLNAWTGEIWRPIVVTDPEADGNPVPRSDAGFAFDAQSGVALLFGGRSGSSVRNDLWSFDSVGWRRLGLSQEVPPARFGAVFIYDPARRVTLLFGGQNGNGNALADTWIWDGRAWNQIAGGPPARVGAMAIYDPVRREVVMYGGSGEAEPGADCGSNSVATGSGECRFRDTWIWDGEWQLRCDSNEATPDCSVTPGQVRNAAFRFDPATESAVLFGGTGDGAACGFEQLCVNTWDWDGTNWRQVALTDPEGDGSPVRRVSPFLMFDPPTNSLLLAGGENEFEACDGASTCNVLWRWTGQSWVRFLDNDSSVPFNGKRTDAGLVYDAAREEIVLFGGRINGVFPLHESITWTLKNREWTSFPFAEPNGRSAPVLVYRHPASDVVLFGGADLGAPGFSDDQSDTWIWNGSTWTEQFSPVSPPRRRNAAFAYDTQRDVVLLFGGTVSVGIGGDCGDGSAPTLGPLCYLEDTWGYSQWGSIVCGNGDDYCWREFLVDGPGRGVGIASAFDESRGRWVLHGGDSLQPDGTLLSNDDTWEWDGARWNLVSQSGPGARTRHVMVYDPDRRKTVLLAGALENEPCPANGTSVCNDVWEWDGVQWGKRLVSDPSADGDMPGRTSIAAAYHWLDQSVWVLDGEQSRDETYFWRWDGGGGATAAHVASFFLAETGSVSTLELEALEMTWSGDGVGFPGGTVERGIRLLVWDKSSWREIDSSAASASAGQSVTWCAASSVQSAPSADCFVESDLRSFAVGGRSAVVFALAPRAPNGEGEGEIASDYLQLTVTYRLP